MTDRIPCIVPLVKVFGLTSGSLLTGYIASFSVTTVPALSAAPISATDVAKQWKHAYNLGKATAPPLAIASASSFLFLAYQARHIKASSSLLSISPSILHLTAAVLAPCIVPYTLTIMAPSISALVSKADNRPDAPSDADTKALLQKWSSQNLNRSYIIATATLLSAIAILA